jgi:DNA polymerase III subunit delta'
MPFDAIEGQAPAVETLTRALRSGRVHHAYRFEGPDGVGKELAAFALAQALVCEKDDLLGCGSCSACRRAVTLGTEDPKVPLHPDVLLLQRGLYPAGLLGASSAEITGISVEQVRRVVLARAGYPPHEGRALVVIVRDADELTVSAANALLKTLEEPGPRTHFVLLTSRSSRLLDTVRSRTLAVRFGPLSETVIAGILERNGKPPAVAALAQGSAGTAFELADPERLEEKDAFVAAALKAVAAPDLATAMRTAETRAGDRLELRALLAHLAQALATRAREAVKGAPLTAELSARHHGVVLNAMNELEKNGQPALVMEAMLARLRRA